VEVRSQSKIGKPLLAAQITTTRVTADRPRKSEFSTGTSCGASSTIVRLSNVTSKRVSRDHHENFSTAILDSVGCSPISKVSASGNASQALTSILRLLVTEGSQQAFQSGSRCSSAALQELEPLHCQPPHGLTAPADLSKGRQARRLIRRVSGASGHKSPVVQCIDGFPDLRPITWRAASHLTY